MWYYKRSKFCISSKHERTWVGFLFCHKNVIKKTVSLIFCSWMLNLLKYWIDICWISNVWFIFVVVMRSYIVIVAKICCRNVILHPALTLQACQNLKKHNYLFLGPYRDKSPLVNILYKWFYITRREINFL